MKLSQKLQEAYEEAGLTAEQITALEAVFTDAEILKKLEAQVMKNADYTTKTTSLAEDRRKLDDERKKWNEEQDTYLGTLSTYKKDMETRLTAALKQAADSRVYGAALETKLTKIAAEYGVDAEELMADVKEMRTKEPAKKDTPAYDDEEFKKRYVPRDEFQSTAESVFGFAPMLRDLDREYHKLYGKEYDGSMQELVKRGVIEVNAQRARGKQTDLYSYMREQLEFDAQKARNVETDKVKSAEETKKWQEDQRKEIEQQVRSEYLAANPGAARQAPAEDAWRENLSAAKRQERQADTRTNTARDTFKRQQEVHKAYEERAAKTNAA